MDKYAELKAAYEAGHTIEIKLKSGRWKKLHDPKWNENVTRYRALPPIPEEYKSIKFKLYLTVDNRVASSTTRHLDKEYNERFKCWLTDEICLGDL